MRISLDCVLGPPYSRNKEEYIKMKRLVLAFFTLTLALLISCQGAQKPTVLVYGTTDKTTDLDTASAYDFHTWEIFQNSGEGLLSYAPGETTIIPGLASSYTANATSDEFTFTLRPNLKFSNGDPLDAGVVKWSIDRVMTLKGDPSWLVTDFVKSVEVVNATTVKFVLKGPIAYFPALVATPTYFPVDPKAFPVDKIIKDPSELTGGTIPAYGPYQLTSYKKDEEAIFETNPNYWGKKPSIGKIIIRYFADATTMRLAFEKGEIDLAYKTLNPSDIKDLVANTKYSSFKLPGPFIRYLTFETSQSVFKDKKLRQAVAALVNRPDINDKVFLGQNAPLYSMIPNGMVYHSDDFKTVFGDGNVAAAETILKGLGYTAAKPFKFDLWYSPTHYGDTEVNVAEVLKNQLEQTPLVKVTLKTAEWAAYKQQWNKKQMPVFLLGWYPDYIDPDDYTAVFGGTTGSAGMGIFFSDKAWDDLFTQEQTSTDATVRQTVFEKVQQLWTDEVITVPLFQGNLYVFTRPNVTGVKIGPTLIFNYNQLQFTK
jgi:peptide/nickel transport system substrate-binding protein